MKKLFALILVCVMALSFVACGGSETATAPSTEPAGQTSSEPAKDPIPAKDPDVEKFVEDYGEEFATGVEEGISSSAGVGCKCQLSVEGSRIKVDCLLETINNIPDDKKSELQEIYDGMKDNFKAAFGEFKKITPAISAIILNVCEEDGDILATINVEL